MMNNCFHCGNVIPLERLKILPGTHLCVNCSNRNGPKKLKGTMIYSHKTAPTIQLMDADYFNEEWKRYNPKFGRGSGVHKFIKSY